MDSSLNNVSTVPPMPTVADWANAALSGFKAGELSMWCGGRRTGKSWFATKMMMNSIYGKLGDSVAPHNVSVTKAYQGEWCVRSTYSTDVEIQQWLHDSLGEPGRDRRYRWRKNNTKFGVYFLRHESDLLMFRLRWM